MKLRNTALAAAASVAALLAAGPAQANLTLVSPINFGGTGLGSVNTILTIQSPGNSSFESGSVGRAVGNPSDVLTGDVKTGASQTQTRTIGSLGVTSASDLRVVFNAVEPGNASDILLNSLMLTIYSPTGAALFTSGGVTCPTLGLSCNFPNTFTGAGNSGFVFALDGAQTIAAQAAAFGSGFANNFIGLSASASNATGGIETFFAASAGGTTVAPVPEPETYALMLAGLGALGFVAKRRRKV